MGKIDKLFPSNLNWGAPFLLAIIALNIRILWRAFLWKVILFLCYYLKSHATELNYISTLKLYDMNKRWLFMVSHGLKEWSASLHLSHSPTSVQSPTTYMTARRTSPSWNPCRYHSKGQMFTLGIEKGSSWLTTHSFLVSLPSNATGNIWYLFWLHLFYGLNTWRLENE